MSTCYDDIQSKKITDKITLIGTSQLRVINNVIDDVSYQIYINDNKSFNHVIYKTITPFIELNTGRQQVTIKNKNNTIIDFDILLLAGYNYTLVLIGESNNMT